MTCRSCGAQIADRAIVCYRCGTPTEEPVKHDKPAALSVMPIIVVVILVAVGIAAWLYLRG